MPNSELSTPANDRAAVTVLARLAAVTLAFATVIGAWAYVMGLAHRTQQPVLEAAVGFIGLIVALVIGYWFWVVARSIIFGYFRGHRAIAEDVKAE